MNYLNSNKAMPFWPWVSVSKEVQTQAKLKIKAVAAQKINFRCC